MTTDVELLKFAGQELNDGVSFILENLTFKAAEKKPQFVSNPAADGDVLVEEAHYTPSYFEFTVRADAKPTADQSRELLNVLVELMQGAERAEGGLPLEWTPTGGASMTTYYVLLAEINDIPVTPTGDEAGWFAKEPLMKVKFTCKPFGYKPERVLQAAVESWPRNPLQTLYLKVWGSRPRRGPRNRQVQSDPGPPTPGVGDGNPTGRSRPVATSHRGHNLVTSGFSGTAATRTGAYSEEKTERAPLVNQWAPIAVMKPDQRHRLAEGQGAGLDIESRSALLIVLPKRRRPFDPRPSRRRRPGLKRMVRARPRRVDVLRSADGRTALRDPDRSRWPSRGSPKPT